MPCSCINHWAHWHPHQHHALPFPANKPNEIETDLAYLAKTQDSSVVKSGSCPMFMWGDLNLCPKELAQVGDIFNGPLRSLEHRTSMRGSGWCWNLSTSRMRQPSIPLYQSQVGYLYQEKGSLRNFVVLRLRSGRDPWNAKKSLPPPASARAQAPFSARTACSTARPWPKVGFHTKLPSIIHQHWL